MQQTRIGDRLPQVLQAGDPGHEPLDPHAEAAVREGSVAADVEVPAVALLVEPVLLGCAKNLVDSEHMLGSLATADNTLTMIGKNTIRMATRMRGYSVKPNHRTKSGAKATFGAICRARI